MCPKSNNQGKQNSRNPWFKKRLPALNTSFLEGTQFSRNNFSQSNVVKDAQNGNVREQSKKLWEIFLGEHSAQEKCKTNQPLLVRKTEITSDYGTKWKWKPRITSWFLGVWPHNQSCCQEVKSTNIRSFPEMTQENVTLVFPFNFAINPASFSSTWLTTAWERKSHSALSTRCVIF